MSTLVLGERPAELEALIERRRALGQDLFDEVWEGVYHVAAAPRSSHGVVERRLGRLLDPLADAAGLVPTGPFNLGGPTDFRVPDGGYHRGEPSDVWLPTAAVVLEVVSPDDETYAKLGFYAAHGVDELVVADPATRQVRIWQLVQARYVETGRSDLLDVTAEVLTGRLAWPAEAGS